MSDVEEPRQFAVCVECGDRIEPPVESDGFHDDRTASISSDPLWCYECIANAVPPKHWYAPRTPGGGWRYR